MIFAVVVVFAVEKIVLFVVGNQIAQGKSVVAGDKVDRAFRFSSRGVINVRGPAQARGHGTDESVGPFDEVSDVVSKLTVPFGPDAVVRERADLVQPAGIPRFGD